MYRSLWLKKHLVSNFFSRLREFLSQHVFRGWLKILQVKLKSSCFFCLLRSLLLFLLQNLYEVTVFEVVFNSNFILIQWQSNLLPFLLFLLHCLFFSFLSTLLMLSNEYREFFFIKEIPAVKWDRNWEIKVLLNLLVLLLLIFCWWADVTLKLLKIFFTP